MLVKIQSYFVVGKISVRAKDNSVYFSVKSLKEIVDIIIPHFDKYTLLTEKQSDYELFKEIVLIMQEKQHLNTEGLNKIISLKACLNKGLTPLLTSYFPNIDPVERSVRENFFLIVDPYWITGFVEAEGCFSISVKKSNTYKIGFQTQLSFSIVQHSRDKILMENFISYFNCGSLYENTEHVTYAISKLSLQEIIIPFFQKYPLQGYKSFDYDRFCKTVILMKNKTHLTSEGLEEIIRLKNG